MNFPQIFVPIFVLIFFLIGCAPPPKIDAKKIKWRAGPLTQEEELMFHNELYGDQLYNTSINFNGNGYSLRRKTYFSELAKRGYLPAVAVLNSFDFEKRVHVLDHSVFHPLFAAARNGDLPSACAIFPIAWSKFQLTQSQKDEALALTLAGAKQGHLICQAYAAHFLQENDRNVEAEAYELAAAKAGYIFSIHGVRAALDAKKVKPEDNFDEILCWTLKGAAFRGKQNIRFAHAGEMASLSVHAGDDFAERKKQEWNWLDIGNVAVVRRMDCVNVQR
ncbi:hypothetical protein N8I74_07420 [Chitiniphilus purpureus]|uniref:Sel1 repeat family protein n=1 Tax=Chitiniphilus purpureus TaxID=2981137 RepID=A0ABY6DUU9_9NEIS|nr:hypothetical protein [Chitiniphilus sp. CD1]UXY16836.1 hypothetical protein N8I74_07420 [Chitiniphilus sp. CD1]